MTSKEKANELFNRFDLYTLNAPTTPSFRKSTLYTKQCALIAVDEILEYNSIFNYKLSPLISETRRYWQEVKNEINKL